MTRGTKIIIFSLIALLAGSFFIRDCSPEVPRSQVDSLAHVIDSVLLVDSLTREKEKAVQASYVAEIRDLSATIDSLKSNPTVIYVRKAYPVVDTLILTQDSLIERQAKRLEEVQIERVNERQRFDIVVGSSQALNANLSGLNQSLEVRNRQLQRKVKRQKVVNNGLKILAGGALIWGATR